ncbi:structural protein [Pseudoteredinibacter isoporae]|uniref:structural protein n=1 Tax=Pseudoteredinibacter isoporae TaxID=570281 RepID=UPI00333E93D2
MIQNRKNNSGAAAPASTGTGTVGNDSMARGIRNHNPGNIRHGDNWQGMSDTQTDDAFIQFIAPEWGLRAMARVLNNYRAIHGLNDVAGIISRWAPPFNEAGEFENDTDAYISHVAGELGVSAFEHLPESMLPELMKAIIKHENNNIQPYSDALILQGISMA